MTKTIEVPKAAIVGLARLCMSMLAELASSGKKRPSEDYNTAYGVSDKDPNGVLLWAQCEAESQSWDRHTKIRDSKSTLFCKRLFDVGLDTLQVCRVLEIIEKTCPHCHDANVGCQCINDE